ncbi:hypothetical protein BDZ89DRAFT_1051496 [Hymenopellis radicata]|nr:hypothetical protein BDZ89DRAFT_1051496 [Hymenopellis radicata]
MLCRVNAFLALLCHLLVLLRLIVVLDISWSVRELLVMDGFDEREPRVAADWHWRGWCIDAACRLQPPMLYLLVVIIVFLGRDLFTGGESSSSSSSPSATSCSDARDERVLAPRVMRRRSLSSTGSASVYQEAPRLSLPPLLPSATATARFNLIVAKSGTTEARERDDGGFWSTLKLGFNEFTDETPGDLVLYRFDHREQLRFQAQQRELPDWDAPPPGGAENFHFGRCVPGKMERDAIWSIYSFASRGSVIRYGNYRSKRYSTSGKVLWHLVHLSLGPNALVNPRGLSLQRQLKSSKDISWTKYYVRGPVATRPAAVVAKSDATSGGKLVYGAMRTFDWREKPAQVVVDAGQDVRGELLGTLDAAHSRCCSR